MENINIQSVSDLITNSSTEVFIVYSENNIADIKRLVNSILSILDPSKTFDDYFNIEMIVNYEDLEYIFNRYWSREEFYDEYPELKEFSNIEDDASREKFLQSLSIDTIERYFDFVNDRSYDNLRYPYSGITITSKTHDPLIEEVARIINSIDSIFELDYSCS